MIAPPVEVPRKLRFLPGAPPLTDLALALEAPDPTRPPRPSLIGRERELALLTALVDRAPETGAALLIRGAPGAGKSALLGALLARLPDRPVAVLRASGIRAEANLPYAGLHQLLRPILSDLGSLPRPQRRAIEAAFGMANSTPPDPLLIAIATLDLLARAARPSLVVLVEDAQWMDRRTSDVLSFVSRRLSTDRIVLLVTTRDERRCPILDAGLAELHLDGLGDDEAGRLLAAVAPGIAETVRERLIGMAAGNPLALVDLSAALTIEQLTGRAALPDTIPLTARLERAVAGPKRELPVHGRSRKKAPAATNAADERRVALVADAVDQPDDPPAPIEDPWLLAMSAALGSADAASISEALARCERPEAAPTDLLLAGMASAIVGDPARSRSLLARAAPSFRGEGDQRALAPLFVTEAWNDIHLGRWTDAASEIEAGAEGARDTGQTMWSVAADVAGALLAAMRGDEDVVESALARVGPAAIGRGSGWVASSVEVVRAIDELNAGRPELAFDRLLGCVASSASDTRWAIDHFADAAVLSGRIDEARTLLEPWDGPLEASHGSLHAAAQVYARAVLADDRTADERQCLAIDGLTDWPVHLARMQLHRGRWLRRHRRVADSRAPLRAARDMFESVGAAPLAERARRELRASGERIRQRDITAWDQLSPQESEIAHMAAQGLSNREIGDQLFLSHRTVGAHLYRIFPKLGVTSRGQLHRVLVPRSEEGVAARHHDQA